MMMRYNGFDCNTDYVELAFLFMLVVDLVDRTTNNIYFFSVKQDEGDDDET